MFLEARRLGIHPLVMGPLLVATILLSPFALPVFLVVRAVKIRSATGAARAEDRVLEVPRKL
jgi:hypothetical protein